MAKLVVGIGEAAVSKSVDDEIKTFALGSCVALILLDPKTRCAGMAHVALPDSSIDAEKARNLPCYFADTGVPKLIQMMRDEGAVLHSGFIVKLIGGANVMDAHDHFQIGKRNVTALRKLLWDNNLPIKAEDVGKNMSRTVSVIMRTGQVVVSSANGEEWRV